MSARVPFETGKTGAGFSSKQTFSSLSSTHRTSSLSSSILQRLPFKVRSSACPHKMPARQRDPATRTMRLQAAGVLHDDETLGSESECSRLSWHRYDKDSGHSAFRSLGSQLAAPSAIFASLNDDEGDMLVSVAMLMVLGSDAIRRARPWDGHLAIYTRSAMRLANECGLHLPESIPSFS